jgi:hypothetical protein
VENYVESLGVDFGFFTTSRKGGETSSALFHDRAIMAMECYLGQAGGTPDDLILASWFTYPERTIPEDATGADYPAMRIVLDYGERLTAIQAGAAPSFHCSRQARR